MSSLHDYYDLYAPMVYRRCLALLGDEHDALDAMQVVFVRVLERRPEIDNPPAFLFRAATNVCLNRIRADRRYKERLSDPVLLEIASFDEGGFFAARSALSRLFGGTSESTRSIAVMHYVDGMTLEQVAQAVGLSVSGVRKRLRRLRSQLHTLEAEVP